MLIINNDIIIKDYFWLKKMIDSIEYNKLIGLRTDFYIMAKENVCRVIYRDNVKYINKVIKIIF